MHTHQQAHIEKFSSQADSAILATLRAIAHEEGRQFQSVLDEAFRTYIEVRHSGRARRHVMREFDKSLQMHDDLYHKLAK